MDTASLLLGVVFSSIGLGFFIYGKKQKLNIFFGCGILLMVLPYMVSSNLALGLASLALTAAPFLIKG